MSARLKDTPLLSDLQDLPWNVVPPPMKMLTRGSVMDESILPDKMKNFGNPVNRGQVDKLVRKYQFYKVSQDKAFKECQQA